MFAQCDLRGHAHMLKVVTGARAESADADCARVHAVGARQPKPYIGLCLGPAGALSRVLNRRFTPVTHELLAAAAPGQLSAAQLMRRRLGAGLLAPRQFFLFGSPIQASLSPTMHNNAYKALILPHTYGLSEHTEVGPYAALMADPSFGGASVTIPHKESIMGLLDEVRGLGAIPHKESIMGLLDEVRGLGDHSPQ
eukprot:CAMPEP_0173277408 /NCGR_PEP_ID=MMETSP1143-20121109/4062_1 /TAXON_ID=483371 /ORGANISM="non described non described, Strain CCMP2298" /LENGTH=195 /DNA_ID=CAMNT_0014214493 /DNA_START=253 /DNA_END=838 /DNA_ORIENTATION=+